MFSLYWPIGPLQLLPRPPITLTPHAKKLTDFRGFCSLAKAPVLALIAYLQEYRGGLTNAFPYGFILEIVPPNHVSGIQSQTCRPVSQ